MRNSKLINEHSEVTIDTAQNQQNIFFSSNTVTTQILDRHKINIGFFRDLSQTHISHGDVFRQ